MKILITGGTGLIGKVISKTLLDKGHEVVYLSRTERFGGQIQQYKWDVTKGEIDTRAFDQVDAIIHLAGAGIAEEKWTEKRKKEILASRVHSSTLLYKHISKLEKKPSVFIGGSAVGIYGALTSDQIFVESDQAAKDFLGETCWHWESTYKNIQALGIRTAIIRTGIVLSNAGGALPKMAQPAKWGLGSPLGNGQQYVPWIHEQDIANIFIYALDHAQIQGVYNGVGSEHINNKRLTKLVCKALHRPFIFPAVPSFLLRLLFGEMADAFLKGSRVSNAKIKETGFQFAFESAESALMDLLDK
jgi:uncharacterized protein (TIGR01777 family)